MLFELCELIELTLLGLFELTELALWVLSVLWVTAELAVLMSLWELLVLAVLTELRLRLLELFELRVTELWLLQDVEALEMSLCELSDCPERALIEECELESVLLLDCEVLDSVLEPRMSLIAVSTSVISVVRFVPYLAMSSAVKYSGYSVLIASIRRLRSLKDRA